MRHARKLRIAYTDLEGHASTRTVWPLGLYLYSHVTLLCAWCEHRSAYRAFRTERITTCEVLDEGFDAQNGALMHGFVAAFSGR